METLTNCIKCSDSFDLESKSPRILPCNETICLSCIQKSEAILGGFSIECRCQFGQHRLKSLSDTYQSNTITNYLNSDKKDFKETLKNQVDESKFSLEVAKYETNKHYDSVAMSIDLKVELLIKLIHENRQQLYNKVNHLREQTNKQFESIADDFQNNVESIESFFKENSNENVCSSVLQFNKIQRSIDEVKANAWYFTEHKIKPETNLLGNILNKSFDTNFLKVKNLGENLLDSTRHHIVALNNETKEDRFRQYIIPLSRFKLIRVCFTSKRSIFMELFDETGKIIKKIDVVKDASYYPLFSNTSNRFILCFITNSSSPTNFYKETLSTYNLYDENLNLLKSMSDSKMVESIHLSETKFVCTYTHKSSNICAVFDHEMNFIENFGQSKDTSSPFYMEKLKSAENYREKKLNPVIFKFDSHFIYFYTQSELIIMCKQTGNVSQRHKKTNERSTFAMDEEGNLFEVNILFKEVTFKNVEMNISTTSRFDIKVDEVFLVENNYLAFVDSKSHHITFV